MALPSQGCNFANARANFCNPYPVRLKTNNVSNISKLPAEICQEKIRYVLKMLYDQLTNHIPIQLN